MPCLSKEPQAECNGSAFAPGKRKMWLRDGYRRRARILVLPSAFWDPPPVRCAVLHHIHINCLYMTQFYAAIVNVRNYRNLPRVELGERTLRNR